MKTLRALACISLLHAISCNAVELTSEANVGRYGEDQLRLGATFGLSQHWLIDSGASVVKFNGVNDCVGAVDVTLLHRWSILKKFFLDAGSGLAGWTTKQWGHEDSATAWTFSNKVGFGYRLDKDSTVGLQWRHYSDGFYSPNSSKDFVGLRYTIVLH